MSAALRTSALLVALVAGTEAAAQPAGDLFSRLDGNGFEVVGQAAVPDAKAPIDVVDGDDVVQLERGKRYADVKDLIVAPWGEVRAIVVEDEPHALYSYPWQSARFEPPYERTHIRNLRPFDYGALDIAAP